MLKNKGIKKIEIRNSIIFIFFIYLLLIPFILLFVYGLKKTWADGMSTASLIYFLIGLLILILDVANFKTWNKISNFFKVKKENQEPLTKMEKMQMKFLKIDDLNQKQKKHFNSRFISFSLMIYGIILFCISIPFVL